MLRNMAVITLAILIGASCSDERSDDRKAAGQGLEADVGERIVEGREYQEITCPIVFLHRRRFIDEDDPVCHTQPGGKPPIGPRSFPAHYHQLYAIPIFLEQT